MNEHRRSEVCGPPENGADLLERLGVGQRAGRDRDSDAAAADNLVDIGRVGAVEGDRPPRRERLAQLVHALEMGFDQLAGLLARERLDPDRAGQRDQCDIEPVRADQIRAPARRLVLEVDGPGLLAGTVQQGEPVAAVDERQAVAGGECVEQRWRPDVLVHVDASTRGGHAPNITLNRSSFR